MRHGPSPAAHPTTNKTLDGCPLDWSLSGAITSVHTSTTETALISQTVTAGDLSDNSLNFEIELWGEGASDGSDDVVITLRIGVSGGTMSDVVALTTVTLIDEDDNPLRISIRGRILTAGATGKVLAHSMMDWFQATPLYYQDTTAITGATVNLATADTIDVTAEWDGAAATSRIDILGGTIKWTKV